MLQGEVRGDKPLPLPIDSNDSIPYFSLREIDYPVTISFYGVI